VVVQELLGGRCLGGLLDALTPLAFLSDLCAKIRNRVLVVRPFGGLDVLDFVGDVIAQSL